MSLLPYRTGNWTTIQCTDPAVRWLYKYAPDERWAALDCDHAWSDSIDVWKNIDEPAGTLTFIRSIFNTHHGPQRQECRDLIVNSRCTAWNLCEVHDGSGACSYEIVNSLEWIQHHYSRYGNILTEMARTLSSEFEGFLKEFAPIPEQRDTDRFSMFLDVLGFLTTTGTSRFFHSLLRTSRYFMAHPEERDDIKNSTLAAVAAGQSIMKTAVTKGYWDIVESATFEAYISQVISASVSTTLLSARRLFDGKDDSIKALTDLVSNGKLIHGSANGHINDEDNYSTEHDLISGMRRTLYGYFIPAVLSSSWSWTAVVDSGHDCTAQDPLSPDYLTQDQSQKLVACYQNRLYYLVSAKGKRRGRKGGFETPNGIDKLTGGDYVYISVEELIVGSVRTWQSNGKKNGFYPDFNSNLTTLEDLNNLDITAPGLMRIPVCGVEEAMANWANKDLKKDSDRYDGFPCNKPAP
ncbi:hypothetical protein B0T20DRAFT_359271 [Sordaria brevicollis]|uniref:Uncharacterized protein n=1 Tax=Sordaria brevicollis TaxID=83679 RepID=A0AAE0P950_SORBR|nr:hypothetical protein B0T20DRAFT_359271 [Sordaria brevicollis]